MQIRVGKPELSRFVPEKVSSGQFPTSEAVVEDALSRMMEDELTLTAHDRSAIKLADEEMDRGEFIDFDVFAAVAKDLCSRASR